MATPTITTNTYAGKDLEGVIAQSILRGKTIENGYITVHSDIDSRAVIKTLDGTLNVQDSAAAFNSAGSFTLDEKYLDPKKFMEAVEYDYSTLNATWYASQQPRGRAGDFEAPATLEEAIIEHRSALRSKFMDAAIWRGSVAAGTLAKVTVSAAANVVTGLVPLLEAGTDTVKIDSATGVGNLIVTGMSKAAAAVLTVSSTANLSNGDVITLSGLTGTGYIDQNGKSFAITVINATTFSIPVVSTGFGTFGGTVKASFINSSNALSILTAYQKQLKMMQISLFLATKI